MTSRTPRPWEEAIPHGQPDQIAYVVADLPAAVEAWSAILGREDWRVYTYGPHNTSTLSYRGANGDYSMRLALCGTAPQIELIESLTGPSIYTEWLGGPGPGLHHVGFFVDSVAELSADLEATGVLPVQTGGGYGLDGDGGFAYYEFPGIEGFVEYIEVPQRRRPSESLSPVASRAGS